MRLAKLLPNLQLGVTPGRSRSPNWTSAGFARRSAFAVVILAAQCMTADAATFSTANGTLSATFQIDGDSIVRECDGVQCPAPYCYARTGLDCSNGSTPVGAYAYSANLGNRPRPQDCLAEIQGHIVLTGYADPDTGLPLPASSGGEPIFEFPSGSVLSAPNARAIALKGNAQTCTGTAEVSTRIGGSENAGDVGPDDCSTKTKLLSPQPMPRQVQPTIFFGDQVVGIPFALKAEHVNAKRPHARAYTGCKFVVETPALPTAVIDPNPELLTVVGGIPLEHEAVASGGRVVIGAAADGVTRLLVRVAPPDPGVVTFSLANSSVPMGTLSCLGDTHTSDSVTCDVDNGTGQAVAVYLVPNDLQTTDALVTLDVVFNSDAGAVQSETVPLYLSTPPVVLIHGLWGNRTAWSGLADYLAEHGFPISFASVADYEDHNAGSFDPLAAEPDDQRAVRELDRTISAALDWFRFAGMAATQANVVGHSMGGLVARSRTASTYLPYHRRENYLEGNINKIITVGTPHFGSDMADFLIANRCDRFAGVGRTLEELFARRGRPLGPGIYELQTQSLAIENIGSTQVPSHSVVGIAPDLSATEVSLNLLIGLFGLPTTVDAILGGDGSHDCIVSTVSQIGGVASAPSVVTGVVHADNLDSALDIGETESLEVFSKVASQLLSDADFDVHEGFTRSAPPIVPPQCSEPSGRFVRDTSSAAVTLTPIPGTVVEPGETIEISLTIDDGDPLDGALFFVDGSMLSVTGPGPYATTFSVPTEIADTIEILAYTYGPGPDHYEAETAVIVRPASDLVDLASLQSEVLLSEMQDTVGLVVYGRFDDGSVLDLTSGSSGTAYSTASGTYDVVAVGTNGEVRPVANGEDVVIISNDWLSIEVPVVVDATNSPPDMVVGGDVSLITGELREVIVSGTDPEGDDLSFRATVLPDFATITDLGNGSARVELAPTNSDQGLHPMVLVVEDGGSPPLSSGQTLSVAVVDACPGLATDATCDGIDEDCDGVVDEDVTSVVSTCGLGDCDGNQGQLTCLHGALQDTCDPFEGATTETCDGRDNDCDGAVPVLERDGDGDGVLFCTPDCDDDASELWGRPTSTRDLIVLSDKTSFEWAAPDELGATTVTYDLVRSDAASAFDAGVVCVAQGAAVSAAEDLDDPAPGEIYFYVPRAVNECPSVGSAGTRSDGSERDVMQCR